MKKFISIVLCFLTVLNICSYGVFAAEEQDIEEIIREQVETYAKSIDQKDADSKAADKLAAHGITGRGKKLSADKSHPLTAALFNSELLKACITDSLHEIILTARKFNEKNMYGFGEANWNIGSDYKYRCYVHSYDSVAFDYGKHISGYSVNNYNGKTNGYDSSMEWIAGAAMVDISVEAETITKDEITYHVVCKIIDRFDFDTSNNSGFAGLISGIGAILFREFDWESSVSFDIKVPYFCDHKTENYSFSYDAENHRLNSVSGEGFSDNEATQTVIVNDNGTKAYYHALGESVNLFHNKPWVLEYTVTDPNYFSLSPSVREQYSYPFLWNLGTYHLFFSEYEELGGKRVNNCYGLSLQQFFAYYPNENYTITLENIIDENGKNMIYISVFNNTRQKVALESTPMDDYYIIENGVLYLQSSESDKLSGKDFTINYVGNKQYSFSADYFDLRILENGKDNGSESYFEKTSSTSATCTEKGSVTYTCALCNYSYSESVDPTGHSFGEWYETKAPTVKENGEEKRDCKTCGASETRLTEKLACLFGDVSGDGKINVVDANLARKAAARLENLDENQKLAADVNGDGKVNVVDANLIRKYAAKMINEFPVSS